MVKIPRLKLPVTPAGKPTTPAPVPPPDTLYTILVIAIFSHTVGVLDPEVNVITAFGLTVIVLVAFVVPHDPPEVVNVNVIGVVDPAEAVYVAVLGVAPPLFVNEPLAPSVHTAEVAPPPNDPPNAAEVPPWQIAPITPPTLTVGFGLTVIVPVAVVCVHVPVVVTV